MASKHLAELGDQTIQPAGQLGAACVGASVTRRARPGAGDPVERCLKPGGLMGGNVFGIGHLVLTSCRAGEHRVRTPA